MSPRKRTIGLPVFSLLFHNVALVTSCPGRAWVDSLSVGCRGRSFTSSSPMAREYTLSAWHEIYLKGYFKNKYLLKGNTKACHEEQNPSSWDSYIHACRKRILPAALLWLALTGGTGCGLRRASSSEDFWEAQEPCSGHNDSSKTLRDAATVTFQNVRVLFCFPDSTLTQAASFKGLIENVMLQRNLESEARQYIPVRELNVCLKRNTVCFHLSGLSTGWVWGIEVTYCYCVTLSLP